MDTLRQQTATQYHNMHTDLTDGHTLRQQTATQYHNMYTDHLIKSDHLSENTNLFFDVYVRVLKIYIIRSKFTQEIVPVYDTKSHAGRR
jgi:hypothetical protein